MQRRLFVAVPFLRLILRRIAERNEFEAYDKAGRRIFELPL